MTIANFFELLADGVTGAGTAVVNVFSNIAQVFYKTGADGGPTPLLIFIASGVALTLIMWGIDKIIGLSKLGLTGVSKARAKRSKKA